MVGQKQNMAPMWKTLMKNVDLDEPTSCLDHVYLGCTQRKCEPHETIVEKKERRCLSHVCVLEQSKNYQDGKIRTQKL